MNKIIFNPFPTLTSERLILNKLTHDDAENIFLLRDNDKVNRYIERSKPKDLQEVSTFIDETNNGIEQNKWFYWTIRSHDNERVIGTVCLWNFSGDNYTAEIGYELHPDFQRKGIMSEVISTITDFCFSSLGLTTIEANTDKANLASARLLEKHNFKPTMKKNDRNSNYLYYRLDKTKGNSNKNQ